MKFYIIGAFIGLTVCAFTGVPGVPGVVARVDSWWNQPPEPVVLSALAQKVSDLLDKDDLWKCDDDELICAIDKENQITMQHLRHHIPIFLHHPNRYRNHGANLTEGMTKQEIGFLREKAIELSTKIKTAKLQKAIDSLVKK